MKGHIDNIKVVPAPSLEERKQAAFEYHRKQQPVPVSDAQIWKGVHASMDEISVHRPRHVRFKGGFDAP